MSRRRIVTFLAQLLRCRMSSRDSSLVSHSLLERELLLLVKVGPPTLQQSTTMLGGSCHLAQHCKITSSAFLEVQELILRCGNHQKSL